MNRIEILLLTSLAILCLSVGQIFPVFALYTSTMRARATSTTTIANSGNIIEIETSLKFLKFIIYWGPRSPDSVPQEYIEYTAKFDLINTEFGVANVTHEIKRLNPNAIVLGYKDAMAMLTHYEDYSVVNAHEDWFIHDTDGNRLVHWKHGWYCMDPGNQGWREHFANYVKQKIDLYGFDGVFIDDCWSQLWKNFWTVPEYKVPNYPNWHQTMIDFIRHVKGKLGSKLVIINTPNDSDYPDVADGKMAENFLRKESAFTDINALADISAEGKYYLAWGRSSPDTLSDMMYYMCGYLLGVNGPYAFFAWSTIWSESKGYYPEMDKAEVLGSPTNRYYSYQSVYARDFENGKVLFNPALSSYTVRLDTEYKTLDGQTVSGVTLNAHSGIILIRP